MIPLNSVSEILTQVIRPARGGDPRARDHSSSSSHITAPARRSSDSTEGKVSATLATLRVLAPVAYITAIAATNARSTRW